MGRIYAIVVVEKTFANVAGIATKSSRRLNKPNPASFMAFSKSAGSLSSERKRKERGKLESYRNNLFACVRFS